MSTPNEAELAEIRAIAQNAADDYFCAEDVADNWFYHNNNVHSGDVETYWAIRSEMSRARVVLVWED
jgi:hypothetical protein